MRPPRSSRWAESNTPGAIDLLNEEVRRTIEATQCGESTGRSRLRTRRANRESSLDASGSPEQRKALRSNAATPTRVKREAASASTSSLSPPSLVQKELNQGRLHRRDRRVPMTLISLHLRQLSLSTKPSARTRLPLMIRPSTISVK